MNTDAHGLPYTVFTTEETEGHGALLNIGFFRRDNRMEEDPVDPV